MSEGKHTPGPWKVRWSKHYPGKPVSIDPVLNWNSIRIGSAFGRDYTGAAANAVLIARAPELADENAALRELVRELRGGAGGGALRGVAEADMYRCNESGCYEEAAYRNLRDGYRCLPHADKGAKQVPATHPESTLIARAALARVEKLEGK